MQFVLFISGVGILLFAMQQMESSLAGLGSEQLKHSIKTFTRSPLQGIFLGIIATSILQSSSIVGLMTMAFVGAGVVKLKSAIGIILGSNLGTTFTGWLVTFLGFKLNMTEFFIPFMGIGALGLVLLKGASKNQNIARFSFSFGFLLFGLGLMKDSVIFIVDYVDIASIQDYPPFFFFIFGALLTALIQSSSATMIITLSAMSAGIIQIPSAAALIIGADLGTTSTVIIGSINGPIVKRQVALVHFIFNLVVDLFALACLPLLLFLVLDIFAIADPLFGLVAIHSSFNLAGLLIFYPFIEKLQNFVKRRFPEPVAETLFISNVSVDVPEAASHALEKDIQNLISKSISLNLHRISIFSDDTVTQNSLNVEKIDKQYKALKLQENQLTDYIFEYQRQTLSIEESKRSQQLIVCIRDSLYATKAIKDIHRDLENFKRNSDTLIQAMLSKFINSTREVYKISLKALNEKENVSIDELAKLINFIKETHEQCNTEIYELIDNKHLKKEQASTALNINREILVSGHSLINALEHYLLPSDQAKTVAELLNSLP